MGIPSGLSAQYGIVDEVTYGTAVTVTRFHEFVDESLALDIKRIESRALRAGSRVLRSDRWAAGEKSVAGDVTVELANKSLGLLFKHSFGSVTTSQPDAAGAPTVHEHLYVPGDLRGKSFTQQVGRPDTGGTVRPFTYPGSKITRWEIGGNVGEIGLLKYSTVARDEDTATGLAVASYPAGLSLLTFVQAKLSIAGSEVSARSASVVGDNSLKVDRHKFFSQLMQEPLEAALHNYTGTIDAEFTDLTAYNRFVTGTEAALELLFEGATISGAHKFQIKITGNARFDGETPKVGGPDEIRQSLPFKLVDAGSGAISLLYKTTDSTP